MAERLDIVSQSNFPTNKSNTVEIVTTTKKKVTTASASDIATLVTPAISDLDIATQTNFPIQSSDAQSDFIITTDGGVNNVTAAAAAGLISSYIPTGGGDPHKPDFTADYSENYSDFSNFTGSGTGADPYQIWDEEMFLNARFKINNGGLSSYVYFKQMRDIVWHFDGIGWGMTISNIYIYDTDNTTLLETTSYGASNVYDYVLYNGNGHSITVDLDDFVYNTNFVANMVNFTGNHGKITTATSSNYFNFSYYVFKVYQLENLTYTIKGAMSSSLEDVTYCGFYAKNKLSNIIIKDINLPQITNIVYGDLLYVNTNKTFENVIISNCTIISNYTFKLCAASTNINNFIIENCNISNSKTYITDQNLNKDISNLQIRNCKFKCPNSGQTLITGSNLSNVIIENSTFYSNNSYDVNLLGGSTFKFCNIKNIYVECEDFVAFSIKNKLFGCSVLGYIWCKQLANDGEFYIMKYTGSSALPEGEYAVNYCKNACIFLVDSNSYTYNFETHAYLEADTTDLLGDVEGVITADI